MSYVIAAYTIAFLLVGGYALSIVRRGRAVEREAVRLQARREEQAAHD
jgi:heme exporter protein CcmD